MTKVNTEVSPTRTPNQSAPLGLPGDSCGASDMRFGHTAGWRAQPAAHAGAAAPLMFTAAIGPSAQTQTFYLARHQPARQKARHRSLDCRSRAACAYLSAVAIRQAASRLRSASTSGSLTASSSPMALRSFSTSWRAVTWDNVGRVPSVLSLRSSKAVRPRG